MKKIINKLFEKLGYVPKSVLRGYQIEHEREMYIEETIRNEDVKYNVVETIDSFLCIANTDVYDSRTIKYFFFNDDKEYALICANELCDMLNAKY
jgi:hypothetical protein